jgi:hypothetical protein
VVPCDRIITQPLLLFEETLKMTVRKQLFALLVALALTVTQIAVSVADTPPWIKHKVDFGNPKEYTVRKTPGPKPDPSAYTAFLPLWPPVPPEGTLTPNVQVDPKQSYVYDWVFDPQMKTDADLLRAHEQVHFDLYALPFREYLDNASGLSVSDQEKRALDYRNRVIALDKVFENGTKTHYTSPNQPLWTTEIGSLKEKRNPFSELEKWAKDPARPWNK